MKNRNLWYLQYWGWHYANTGQLEQKWLKASGNPFQTLDDAFAYWKALDIRNDNYSSAAWGMLRPSAYRLYNPKTKDIIMCDIL